MCNDKYADIVASCSRAGNSLNVSLCILFYFFKIWVSIVFKNSCHWWDSGGRVRHWTNPLLSGWGSGSKSNYASWTWPWKNVVALWFRSRSFSGGFTDQGMVSDQNSRKPSDAGAGFRAVLAHISLQKKTFRQTHDFPLTPKNFRKTHGKSCFFCR